MPSEALATELGAVSSLVQAVEDRAIFDIVSGWPAAFEPIHARTLGFAAHEPLVDVVRAFVEDDLEMTRAERGLAT